MCQNSPKNKLKNGIAWLWWHMPFRRGTRQQIKTVVFTLFGFLFRNTRPYKNWKEIRRLSSNIAFPESVSYPSHWQLSDESLKKVREHSKGTQPQSISKIAIVIHAFYPDIFEEIMARIEKEFVKIDLVTPKLYVSTIAENKEQILRTLSTTSMKYHVEVFPNHGRDILPFLRLAEKISDPNTLILKLHTKRSDHRLTGSLWRKELYESMLSAENIKKALSYVNNIPDVGIIGPKGNIVPMNLYFGGNALALSYFCRLFQVSADDVKKMAFVAGSMFFARYSAIKPIIDLHIPESMFEPEAGQNDGTMAHAIERVFSISAHYTGMVISDTSFPKNTQKLLVTKEHPYTW
jgi:lipopolysaccharide biosynthesis protein